MEILNNIDELKQLIADNPDKKIGKINTNFNKLLLGKSFHQGHLKCVETLKSEGCDLIIVEFLNTDKAFNSNNLFSAYETNQILDLGSSITEYESFLGADYILYDADDIDYSSINTATKGIVDERISDENYIEKYNLDSFQEEYLRTSLYHVEERSVGNITFIKSLKNGKHIFALKDYYDKFTSNNMILITPEYDDNGIPLSSTFNPRFEEFKNKPENIDILIFMKFIKNLTDKQLSMTSMIESNAIELGGSVNIETIIHGSTKYIMIFYSGRYTGAGGGGMSIIRKVEL